MLFKCPPHPTKTIVSHMRHAELCPPGARGQDPYRWFVVGSPSLHGKTGQFRDPVSQDISDPDEWEPFLSILALVAGFLGTIPINPDPIGRIFGNHQDISEPTIKSSALMNFWHDDFRNRFCNKFCDKPTLPNLQRFTFRALSLRHYFKFCWEIHICTEKNVLYAPLIYGNVKYVTPLMCAFILWKKQTRNWSASKSIDIVVRKVQ